MTTKVLILAGGRGTRLWPLTDDDVRPKPCAYMGGQKRMLEYVTDLFVKADYAHLYVAVQHMDRNIVEAMGDGSDFAYESGGFRTPLRITYTRSPPGKQFRGTADALRKSGAYLADKVVVVDLETQAEIEMPSEEYIRRRQELKVRRYVDSFDTIVVGSGDVLTNFDIAEIVRAHKQRGVIATIAGYEMDDVDRIVGELGTMTVGHDGMLEGFDEKPKTREVVKSRIINPGIYVFDASIINWLDDVTDFGKHLFPELMREEEGVFVPIVHGYWNDVGTIPNYRKTNLDLIKGIDGVDISSHRQMPLKTNRLLGQPRHTLIAQGCLVEHDTDVSNSVLCNDVTVKRGAKVENSVVLAGSYVGEDIACEDCVIDGEVVIEKGARLGKSVVLGKHARIKSGAIVHPGVKIAPGEIITGEVREDVVRED